MCIGALLSSDSFPFAFHCARAAVLPPSTVASTAPLEYVEQCLTQEDNVRKGRMGFKHRQLVFSEAASGSPWTSLPAASGHSSELNRSWSLNHPVVSRGVSSS